MSSSTDTSATDTTITLLVQSEVKPGQLDKLREIVPRLEAFVAETEPDTLSYKWFIDEAGANVRVVEVYRSPAALQFHGQNYASFAKELEDVRAIVSVNACGALPDTMKDALAKRGSLVFSPISG